MTAMAPLASVVESYPAGHWAVYARPVSGARVDITFVRGVKTKVASLTTTDPGGPAAGQLTFPAISYLDALGSGDLWWLVPNVNVDVVWTSPQIDTVDSDGAPITVGSSDVYTWEGYAAEWDFGEEDAAGGLTVPLIGAIKQADNYLAKPEYPYQPYPYEIAIAHALDSCPDLRVARLTGLVQDKALPVLSYTGVSAPAGARAPGNATATGSGWVSVNVTAHGYDVKDKVVISEAAVLKGKVNNGTYSVIAVPDANHFIVWMTLPALGKQVTKPGYATRQRSSMFPDWWTKTFNRYDTVAYPPGQPWLLPIGISHGQKWSGMLTRDTGKFEPVWSNYIAGLLANMNTLHGQFTLLLAPGRVPYLTHRDHLHAPDARTLVVDVLWPGVKISPRVDHTQQIGVIYAQGKATNGDTYTGMQVTADGNTTWYDPAAYRRQVHPQTQNPWLDRSVMRKEVMINFSDGLDEQEAWRASADHLQRFSDPGVTATITLTTDPRLALAVDADGNVTGGTPVPRQTISAGQSIQVKGLFGRVEGVLFHISEATVAEDSTVQLTVDSLYRDHLTVDQVRKRGHDALVPYRMLSTSGTYDPKIPDLLYPWSYSKGSGVIPFGGATLFSKYGPSKVPVGSVANVWAVPFPWTPYTTRYPPRKYPQFYVRVLPADHTNANNNWANAWNVRNTSKFKPYYLTLAAAGDIKLFQIAAYDLDGNVKPVPFHVSLYYQSVSYTTMPMIPSTSAPRITKVATAAVHAGDATITVSGLPKTHGFTVGATIRLSTDKNIATIDGDWPVATVHSTSVTIERPSTVSATASSRCTVWSPVPIPGAGLQYPYDAGQHYPFFAQAWEKILPDGSTPLFLPQTTAVSDSPMLYGAGTFYEKAGYWPGSSSDADRVTGMFVDETGFPFEFRNIKGRVDPQKTPYQNQNSAGAASALRITAYVMIYCDADVAASTYFLGRCFRKEFEG